MHLKSVIFDLTPPLLLRAVNRLRSKSSSIAPAVFDGSYPSLDDVPDTNSGYDENEFAEVIVDNRLPFYRAIGTAKTANDQTGQTILPTVVSQFANEPLTVIDFGGGPGIGLIGILNQVRGLNLDRFRYISIETPAMCRATRAKIEPFLIERFGTSSFFEIAPDIPTSAKGSVIVNAGSSLQYVSKYRDTLSRLARLKPLFFIISNTPMTDGRTYARQQINMAPRKLASWVFNRYEIVKEMRDLGYDLALTMDHELNLTHRDAPYPSAIVSMAFRPLSSRA